MLMGKHCTSRDRSDNRYFLPHTAGAGCEFDCIEISYIFVFLSSHSNLVL